MGHQCTHCGEIYPDAAPELLAGCKCGSKFFYYIRQEKLDELNRINNEEILGTLTELARADKTQIEKDIREITGMEEEPDKPVILDLESVKVLGPGKFEIDIVNLFSKKRPVIYKLEEGKYIIDLASTYKPSEEIHKKIRNPEIDREEMDRIKEKAKEEKAKAKKEEKDEKKKEEKAEEKKEMVSSTSKDVENSKFEKKEEKKEKSEDKKEGEENPQV